MTNTEQHNNYLLAMETVRIAMRSGATPSATEACIAQYVERLRLDIASLAPEVKRLRGELHRAVKCGIHDSCAGCHHENSDGVDERTCIQKLHDDFHERDEFCGSLTR